MANPPTLPPPWRFAPGCGEDVIERDGGNKCLSADADVLDVDTDNDNICIPWPVVLHFAARHAPAALLEAAAGIVGPQPTDHWRPAGVHEYLVSLAARLDAGAGATKHGT